MLSQGHDSSSTSRRWETSCLGGSIKTSQYPSQEPRKALFGDREGNARPWSFGYPGKEEAPVSVERAEPLSS